VENALVGFFFEISKGATVAGNVFVGCGRGLWALNSRDVRAYHNTFVDSVASFERNERSATGDHFGWHPSTGPDVDEREGHVFVGNLLFASESFQGPLLQFEQAPGLCGRLTRPQAKEVDGNVYVRAGTDGPLLVWSPVGGEDCHAEVGSLEELSELVPGLEARGRSFDGYVGALFRSPELSRLELARVLPGLADVDDLPEDVRRLLGWREGDARAPGAYPYEDSLPNR
jgi:hypothetical protein